MKEYLSNILELFLFKIIFFKILIIFSIFLLIVLEYENSLMKFLMIVAFSFKIIPLIILLYFMKEYFIINLSIKFTLFPKIWFNFLCFCFKILFSRIKFLIIKELSCNFNNFTILRYFAKASFIKIFLFCFNKILFLKNKVIIIFLFLFFFCFNFSFKYFLIIIALSISNNSLTFLLYFIKIYFLIIVVSSLIEINFLSIL